ncbi:MAG: hypothetical protein OXN95_00735 [bacterium]|nr:hypothetical protein [bacterium]
MKLVEQVVDLHRALDDADIPHAFGGALALAWCTQQAIGTIDIDLNLFVNVDEIERALAALPEGISISEANRRELEPTVRAVCGGAPRQWTSSSTPHPSTRPPPAEPESSNSAAPRSPFSHAAT